MSVAPILTILRDGETVKKCEIEGEAMLGRAEGCVIRLDDRAVSRHHAMFKRIGDGVQVEKKSAFSPLTVNGAECTRAVLKEGDVIVIGPYLVKLSLAKAAAVAVEPAEDATPIAPGAFDNLEFLSEPAPIAPAPVTPAFEVSTPEAPESALVAEGVVNLELAGAAPIELVGQSAPAESPGAAAIDAPLSLELAGGNSEPLEIQAPEAASERSGSLILDVPMPSDPQPDPVVADPDAQANSYQAIEGSKTRVLTQGKLQVRLIFKPGDANVTEFEITQDEISIGRGKNCDIILNDKKASRKNTIIRRNGATLTIKDLDSANGTYVNGVQIQEQELSSEDLIRIGGVEFQLKAVSLDYLAKEPELAKAALLSPGMPEDLPDLNQMLENGGSPISVESPGPIQLQGTGMMPMPDVAAMPASPGIPGIQGIPGIAGAEAGAATGKRRSVLIDPFIQTFKKASPLRKILIIAALAFIIYSLVFEDDNEQVATPKKKGATQQVLKQSGLPAFENLTPEQKRFVEAQHALAFDYYKNKDYDKALFELDKIFALTPDYKDSREIERYAKEGKRKLEAFEEEKRRKDDEDRIKAKIAQLVDEVRENMAKKQYDQAKEKFAEILSLDPDNVEIGGWKKEIEDYEEKVRLEEQQKTVQAEINKRAAELFAGAKALEKKGKYHAAIADLVKAIDIGASDPKLVARIRATIRQIKAAIQAKRDPLLAEAKHLEESGDLVKAFELYRQSTVIDPGFPAGYAGMSRVRGILHDRAKMIYTEAVLAEGYSDFETAKKRFKECMDVAPKDDLYHDRAERKLSHYFLEKEEASAQ